MLTEEVTVIKKIVRHIHAPAQAFRSTDLSGASIADLGTRDHDLLTGLTDDDHTQYFHTDGTDPMTGNLTAQNILAAANNTYNMGDATNAFKWLYLFRLQLYTGIYSRVATTLIQTRQNAATDKINFQSYDGASNQNAAVLTAGEWQIPRAGDITFAANTNYLQFDTDLRLARNGANLLSVQDPAGAGLSDVELYDLYIESEVYATSNACAFYTNNAVDADIIFFSHTGAAYEQVLRMVGGYVDIDRGGDINMLDQKMLRIGTYTDAQRPAAGFAGRVIFNTDDGMPSYDDGTDWRDINGNIT